MTINKNKSPCSAPVFFPTQELDSSSVRTGAFLIKE